MGYYEGRDGVMWFLPKVWELRGIRRYRDKGRCPLCLGEVKKKAILETLFHELENGE